MLKILELKEMTKSVKAIRFNNRIIDVVENLRLLGAIDFKTEGLIRLKINEVFNTIDREIFPGSKFSCVQEKYKKEIDRVFIGTPKFFERFITDLICVIQFVLSRLEYERVRAKKLNSSIKTDKENLKMISDYLNKIVSDLVVFNDVLEDFQYKLADPIVW